MLHHIIVKFNENVTDKDKIICEASKLFNKLNNMQGIYGVKLIKNCIDRSNRYDLMIVIDMDKEVLPIYDNSEPHKKWKEEFGKFILSKAIFDCDN